ncbi:MAG: OsmC family protein [Pseudomonadota bacterium]
MTYTATARSVPGTLRQELLVGGRHRLVTDQALEHGGDDEGPSPHELLPAALAGCVAFVLERYARTKGWELGEVEVDVEYDPTSTPRHCEIVVSTTADLSPEQLERLERAAAACPVRRSFERGFEFVERFELRSAVAR